MAGFFEGEGSFGWSDPGSTFVHPANGKAYRKNPYLFFRIPQNELDVLETFLAMAGIGTINGPYLNKSGTQFWRYSCSPDGAYALIVAMWPWLHSKRQREATAAIKHWLQHPRQRMARGSRKN